VKLKKLIILNLPLIFVFYFCMKLGEAYRLAEAGANVLDKLSNTLQVFTTAFQTPASSMDSMDLIFGLVGAVVFKLVLYTKGKNAKKYRRGSEYGSARWGVQ